MKQDWHVKLVSRQRQMILFTCLSMFKRFVCEFVNVKRVKSIKDDKLTNETCAYR